MESYFRHRWLYLIPIVLMMVAACAFFFLSKPKYIASGVIFVQKESLLARLTSVSDPSFSWSTPASVTVGELSELLQTDAFIRAVISQTDLEAQMDQGITVVNQAIEDVRKAVWVSSIGNNQVRVSASDEQPKLATQLADATITSFVQWKINADRTDSEAAHNFFTDIISKYKADLDLARQNMNDYLLVHPDPLKGERPVTEQLEITRLQAEIDLAQTRYASALSKDEDARLAALQAESDARQSYVIIDAPRMPTKPDVSLKQTAVKMLIFVVLGVFLSGMGIVGGAVIDRTFRFPVDVWFGVDLPVLAMVPDGSPSSRMKRLMRAKKEKIRELDHGAGSVTAGSLEAGSMETEPVENEGEPSDELGQATPAEKVEGGLEFATPENIENEIPPGEELGPVAPAGLEQDAPAPVESKHPLARKQKKMKSSSKKARSAPAGNEDGEHLAGEVRQGTDGEGEIEDGINPEAMQLFGAAIKDSEKGDVEPTK
jgi:capsular polysaccharide biosynthesis protein